MAKDLVELERALDLERIESTIFRGMVPQAGRSRVFGGLVVAQALAAACRTVERDRAIHSLHAYFILPGEEILPIVYQVERIRDGRSFSTRHCHAVQAGRVIFEMVASFHAAEPGLDFQVEPPTTIAADAAPDPKALIGGTGHRIPLELERWIVSEGAIVIRPCSLDRYDPRMPPQAEQRFWMRTNGRLGDDLDLHRAMLAYMSDHTLIDAALAPHGRSLFEPSLAVASLDHAIWFHRHVRVDDWLLYVQDSPSSAGGRGLARGLIFDSARRLVASVAQEGLLRRKTPS